MAIASILHRISGIVMFLLLPFLLYHLSASLESAERFTQTTQFFQGLFAKFLLWGAIVAFIYHVVAGLRHLAMDCGYFETLSGGRKSAITVIGLSVILSLLVGIWLW